jgi:site-specific DNA-adenine methylase
MPLSFDQIERGLQSAQSRGHFKDLDVRQFSQLANRVTGSEDFKSGDVGALGRFAVDVDRTLRGASEKLGLDVAGQRLGGFVAEKLFDNRPLGEEVGLELGETALSFAPALIGLLPPVAAVTGGLSIPIGLGLTGGLTAAHVSAQTGDPVRSVAAGAIAGFTPPLIGKGAQLLTSGARATSGKVLGEGITSTAESFLNKFSMAGIPARTVPSVAAGFGVDVGADVVDIGLSERTLAELASPEYWQARTIGNLAFLPLDIQQSFALQKRARLRLTAGEADMQRHADNNFISAEGLDDPVIKPKPFRSVEDEFEPAFDEFFQHAAEEERKVRGDAPDTPRTFKQTFGEEPTGPTPLDRLTALDTRARELGFDDARQLNMQNVTREVGDMKEGVQEVLEGFGQLNSDIKKLRWREASELPDTLYKDWETTHLPVLNDAGSIVPTSQNLAGASKTRLATHKRGDTQKSQSIQQSIEGSREKTDWTIEQLEEFTGQRWTQEEVNKKNQDGEDYNDLLDYTLEKIEKEINPGPPKANLNKKPTNQEEFKEQLEELNKVRDDADEPLIDNTRVAAAVRLRVEGGTELGEAEARVVQALKNEANKLQEKQGKVKDEDIEIVAQTRTLKLSPEIQKKFESYLNSKHRDDQLVQDLVDVILNPDLNDTARLRKMANARKRASDRNIEKEKGKVGRPAKEVDQDDVAKRINELEGDKPGKVLGLYERFVNAVEDLKDTTAASDSTRSYFKAVDDWLNQPAARQTLKVLEGKLFSLNPQHPGELYRLMQAVHKRKNDTNFKDDTDEDFQNARVAHDEYNSTEEGQRPDRGGGKARSTQDPQEYDALLLRNTKPPLPVAGNKRSLVFHPEFIQSFRSAVAGHDVVDAFSGSGIYAVLAKQGGANSVQLNVRNSDYLKVFQQMKQDPAGLAKRVAALAEGLEFSREGIKGDIKGAILRGRQTDPVASLVLNQLVSARGFERGLGRISVGRRTVGKDTLDTLEERFGSMTQVDSFSNKDGWQVVQDAHPGQTLLVDPPFVGTRNDIYDEVYGVVTVESRLKDYKRSLIKANKNGVRLLVTDSWQAPLVKFLRKQGFTVNKIQRPNANPELVARNFEKRSFDPLLLKQAVTARNEFILGLEKVLKIDEDTGQLFVGSEKKPIPKSGLIPEDRFVKYLGKSSVSKDVWEAFKIAYPGATFKDSLGVSQVAVKHVLRLLSVRGKRVITAPQEGFVRNETHGMDPGFETPGITEFFRLAAEANHQLDTIVGDGNALFENYLRHREPGGKTHEDAARAAIVEATAVGFNRAEEIPNLLKEVFDNQALIDSARVTGFDRDFASEHAGISPYNPKPFDSATGLGDTAGDVRIRGIEGGGINHVLDSETLVWFRGTFVDQDGVRTYVAHEFQSDVKQRYFTGETNIKKGKIIIEKGGPSGSFWGAAGYVTFSYKDKNTSLRLSEDIHKLLKTNEAAGRTAALRVWKDTQFHPLYPHAETIGMRSAILHAIQNGAEKIVMPDSNTVMLTEGHDRAVVYTPEGSIKKVGDPYNYDHHTKIPEGWTKLEDPWGVYAKDPNGVTHELKAADVRYPPSGNQITDVRPPSSGLPKAQVYAQPVRIADPIQAPGMRQAYDVTLPNGMAKLTGDRGDLVDLGRHDKSPSLLLGRQELTIKADEDWQDFWLKRLSNPELKQFIEAEQIPGGGAIFKGSRARMEALIEEVSDNPAALAGRFRPIDFDRPPVLFTTDAQGKSIPHTQITGRSYSLAKAKKGFEDFGGLPLVGREAGFESMRLPNSQGIYFRGTSGEGGAPQLRSRAGGILFATKSRSAADSFAGKYPERPINVPGPVEAFQVISKNPAQPEDVRRIATKIIGDDAHPDMDVVDGGFIPDLIDANAALGVKTPNLQAKILQQLKKEGFDSVKFPDQTPTLHEHEAIAVFDPNQFVRVRPQGEFESFLPTETISSLLQRDGHTPNFADYLAPEVHKVGSVLENLIGERVPVGTIFDPTGAVAGMSSRSSVQRAIFGNPANRPQTAKYALLHEGFGHQIQKAHEDGLLPPDIDRAYVNGTKAVIDASATEPKALGAFIEGYGKSVLDPTTFKEVGPALRASGADPAEAQANLAALAAWDSINKSNPYEHISALPYPLARMVTAMMRFVRDLVKGVKSWFDYRKFRGTIPDEVWKGMKDLDKQFSDALRKVEDQDFKAMKTFERLGLNMEGEVGRYRSEVVVDAADMTFDGNRSMQMAADAMLLPGMRHAKKILKQAGRTYGEIFDPVFQKSERYPANRDAVSALRGESNIGHATHHRSVGLIYGEKDAEGHFKLDKFNRLIMEKKGPASQVLGSRVLRPVFDDLIRLQNVHDIDIFRIKEKKPEVFTELMQGRSEGEVGLLLEVASRFKAATMYIQSEIINVLHKKGEKSLARILRDKLEGTNREVLASAEELYGLFRDGRISGDPTLFNNRAAELGLRPKTLENFLEPFVNKVAKQKEFYENHQHYVTEKRFGRYHVAYDVPKEKDTGRDGFDSPEEAAAFAKTLPSKGLKSLYPGLGYKDMWKGAVRTEGEALDSIIQFTKDKTFGTAIEGMEARGEITPDVAKDLRAAEADFGAALEAVGMTNNLTELGPARRHAPGVENLDMGLQHLTWLSKVSRAIPRVESDAILRFEAVNPAILADQNNIRFFEQIQQAKNQFRQQDTPLGQFFLKGAFMHYIMFNISTGMIEASSFPFWLTPQLTEEGASIYQSYNLPRKASAAIVQHRLTNKWGGDATVKIGGKKVSAWGAMIDRAASFRLLGRGRASEFFEAAWQQQEDLARIGKGMEPMGNKLLTKPFHAFFDAGAKLYSGFVTVNSEIGFISAFELKRQQMFGNKKDLSQKEFDQLFEESHRIVQVVNNDIGRAGRPVGLFSGWRTPAMVINSLQSFNSAQISNLWRRFVKGFNIGETAERFTPQERRQALKAFTQSFSTLVAGAGVMGAIPFAGALMALLEKHTDLEIEKNIRGFLADVDGDGELSPFSADLAMHGLAHASGVPYDLSGRLGLSGMTGANEFEGWSMKSFMGPVASQYSGYIKGAEDVFKGNFNKTLENVLPRGFRNLYMAVRDDGRVQNKAGKPIFTPTENERIAMMIGFRPAKLTNMRDMDNINYKSEQVIRDRNKRITGKAADIYHRLGPLAAGNFIRQMSQEHKGFSLQGGYDALAGFVGQQELGYDQRRRGSVQGALEARKIAQTFPPNISPKVSETQAELTKFRNLLSFGDTPGDPMQRFKNSILVDALQSQTGLNFPAARFLARKMTSPDPETLPVVQAFLSNGR